MINDTALPMMQDLLNWKYVDDPTFAENYTVQWHLQDDLHKFSEWASTNGLNLNAKKCQALDVNFSRTSPHHVDLQIGTDKLECIDRTKILELDLDPKQPEMVDPDWRYAKESKQTSFHA